VRWLLWLYPRAWRRRYGQEYLALVEELGPSPRVLADVLVGAVGAHLDALRPVAAAPSPAPLEVAPAAEPAGPAPARRPLAGVRPDQWESVMDRIVREAQERGAFDNLAGAGRPLPNDENPFAGEWDMAFRFVRQAGETLPWIGLGREIEAELARLDGDLDGTAARLGRLRVVDSDAHASERSEARSRYLARAATLDARIAEHARLVPHPRFERPRLTATAAARRFDGACPD
jgi:hypothetical protein